MPAPLVPARWRTLLLAAAILALARPLPAATALRPAEITPEQASAAPYRDSGRIMVEQGYGAFIGTASYIRRYTGLTAGHILYNPKNGFSTNLRYEAALYIETTYTPTIMDAMVLAGYQDAADQEGNDSVDAFAEDMGYFLFSKPALNDEWVSWAASPATLLTNGPFLAVGYAAESFDGDELASVQAQSPYALAASPAFYDNQGYYTEGGMSGGPVYAVSPGGAMTMLAINVAGTGYQQEAHSGVRAITPAETPLLLSAEYTQGIISGGIIKGPSTLAAGGTGKFKVGLTFPDGAQVNNAVAAGYDADLKLVAAGPYKRAVTIAKTKPGKYTVTLPAGIPSGTQVPLRLLRNVLSSKGQTPLQTLTVTVQ